MHGDALKLVQEQILKFKQQRKTRDPPKCSDDFRSSTDCPCSHEMGIYVDAASQQCQPVFLEAIEFDKAWILPGDQLSPQQAPSHDPVVRTNKRKRAWQEHGQTSFARESTGPERLTQQAEHEAVAMPGDHRRHEEAGGPSLRLPSQSTRRSGCNCSSKGGCNPQKRLSNYVKAFTRCDEHFVARAPCSHKGTVLSNHNLLKSKISTEIQTNLDTAVHSSH